MGAGVFSLPWAVAQGGIVFVPAFILAAAALALHTLSMLVAAKRKILQLRPDAVAQARHRRDAPRLRRCLTRCTASQVSSYTGIIEAALGPVGGRTAEARMFSSASALPR
jgi:hypothetical protein